LKSAEQGFQPFSIMVAEVSSSELKLLEDSLLNNSGNVPLHNRFRALFTLKALKTDEAVRIISEGSV
jgi:deoxyhypusine monooxygenase